MQCVHCEIGPCQPESVAGLCVSCAESIRRDLYAVEMIDGAPCIIHPSATPENPLGSEDGIKIHHYCPELHLPSDTPYAILSEMIAELFRLNKTRPWRMKKRAVDTLAAIRERGTDAKLDVQIGQVILLEPRRIPYQLLLEFVELIPWIADLIESRNTPETDPCPMLSMPNLPPEPDHLALAHKSGPEPPS